MRDIPLQSLFYIDMYIYFTLCPKYFKLPQRLNTMLKKTDSLDLLMKSRYGQKNISQESKKIRRKYQLLVYQFWAYLIWAPKLGKPGEKNEMLDTLVEVLKVFID